MRADAERCCAGDRANARLIDCTPASSSLCDPAFVEQRVAGDDRIVVVARQEHVLGHDAAQHAIAQRLDDVAAFDDRGHGQTFERAAIGLGDHHVLRHVDQATGQVTGVRGLQRGIGQALTSTVGRDEVLQNVRGLRGSSR